jgi:hypothetical protein
MARPCCESRYSHRQPVQPYQVEQQFPVSSSQLVTYASPEPEGVSLCSLLTGAAIAVLLMLLRGAALLFMGVIRLP